MSGNNKGSTPSLETPEERIAWLKSLNPDEREAVREYAWDRLLRSRKVEVDGKTMSLKAFRDQVAKEKEAYDKGLYQESTRTIPRWQARRQISPADIRPGAKKQMLRKEEEEKLALDKMGNGNYFGKKPFGPLAKILPGRRDFAFGIYARPAAIENWFKKKWAGKNPELVLNDQSFYSDIVRKCHELELTLMVYPVRPLPLKEMVPAMKSRLESEIQRRSKKEIASQDKTDLESFISLFDETRLGDVKWIDRGNIKPETHIIMAAAPGGGMTIEAISPGPVSQRTTTFIGITKNPNLSKAVFDSFLGPEPIDDYGKLYVGHGVFWCANGLRLHSSESQPGVYPGALGKDGKPEFVIQGEIERFPASTRIFSLTESQPMLLDDLKK